ncbi:MAG TPA: hypothetical protein VHN79_02295 [Lacunisphaera sp.]|nr:hypothetical protein [Lacunisphaera sp.]
MKYLSTLPLVCYALMFAFTCYVATVLGHWPYYANPDPKELRQSFLVNAVTIAMLLGALSLLLVPLGYAIWRAALRIRQLQTPPHRAFLAVYFVGLTVWVFDLMALHGGMPWHSIVDWLLD